MKGYYKIGAFKMQLFFIKNLFVYLHFMICGGLNKLLLSHKIEFPQFYS